MLKSKTDQKTAAFHFKDGFLRNGKALSPIFATLIILAVVTVLFIPVFIWATRITSQNQEDWIERGTAATERIVIEEVNLKNGISGSTIYVRNIGETAVTINSVLISRADDTGTISAYQKPAFLSNPNSVVKGNLITINIPILGFDPGPATAYNIKVVTTRDASDVYQAVT